MTKEELMNEIIEIRGQLKVSEDYARGLEENEKAKASKSYFLGKRVAYLYAVSLLDEIICKEANE